MVSKEGNVTKIFFARPTLRPGDNNTVQTLASYTTVEFRYRDAP